MTSYTVSIDGNSPDAALHRTVLASLPNSYRLVEGVAEVVLASASDPASVERACSSGSRAVVVDHPGLLLPDDLSAMADAADRNGCIVAPAPRYAPRLAAEGDLMGAVEIEILESTIVSGGSLRSALVEQLAMVRAVLGAAASIRVLHTSTSHYACEATMMDRSQSRVLLNGVTSPCAGEEANLHALAAERRLVVRIDAGPVARPAEICCYDDHGARTPWPVHQHSHRITLSQLHRLLTTGQSTVTYSLEDLRHDTRLATVVVP